MLIQDGLERRRITRLMIFGNEFFSFLPEIGFDFSLSLFYCEAEIRRSRYFSSFSSRLV
jgi:hypothetical protein